MLLLLLLTAGWNKRRDYANIVIKIMCREKHQKHTPQKLALPSPLPSLP